MAGNIIDLKDAKRIQYYDKMRVVTANNMAALLSEAKLSFKELMFVIIAMAQAKKDDTKFYAYEISASEFARITGDSEKNVKALFCRGKSRDVNNIDETSSESFRNHLLGGRPITLHGDKLTVSTSIFLACAYGEEDHTLTFLLNPILAPYVLQLSENFCKPLLKDMAKLNTRNGLLLWWFYQSMLGAEQPSTEEVLIRRISVEQITAALSCQITNTGSFERDILGPAHKDIFSNLGIKIEINSRFKTGRKVTAYDMTFIKTAPDDADEGDAKDSPAICLENENAERAMKEYICWWAETHNKQPSARVLREWKKKITEWSDGDMEKAASVIRKAREKKMSIAKACQTTACKKGTATAQPDQRKPKEDGAYLILTECLEEEDFGENKLRHLYDIAVNGRTMGMTATNRELFAADLVAYYYSKIKATPEKTRFGIYERLYDCLARDYDDRVPRLRSEHILS